MNTMQSNLFLQKSETMNSNFTFAIKREQNFDDSSTCGSDISTNSIDLPSAGSFSCSSSPHSFSCDINKTFSSVYIDKDDDYLTRQNATFTVQETDDSSSECKTLKRSRSLKFVGKKAKSRRKFYKWASMDDFSSLKDKKPSSSSQRIARRLGLSRTRTSVASSDAPLSIQH